MPGTFSVRVRGGARLRKFIAAQPTGREAAAKFVQLFPIAQLRDAAPHRTGRLARSLHLVRVGTSVELRGVFYANFNPNKGPIVAKFFALAETTAALVRRSYFS